MGTDLTGRVVLVTGAGRGIGREVAAQSATTGAVVGLVARSSDQLEEAVGAIRAAGGRAVAFRADLQETASIPDLAAQVVAELGRVDVLINNAGMSGPLGASATADLAEWSAALAVNVTAPAALTFALLPDMLAQGWGRIVNVSSIAVFWPTAMVGTNAYVTSKSALEAHTVNLAAELKDTGVRVNAFRPGAVDTDMHAALRNLEPGVVDATLQARFIRAHEEGTLVTPSESARSLLAHLDRDETGQIWDVSDDI
jgi:NAD(P)-dependent dehydrogenase (short-subunit alcohol dehydrogenase family)